MMTIEEVFEAALTHKAVIKNGSATMQTSALIDFAHAIEATALDKVRVELERERSAMKRRR